MKKKFGLQEKVELTPLGWAKKTANALSVFVAMSVSFVSVSVVMSVYYLSVSEAISVPS